MVEWRIRQLDVTASTNDDAKAAAMAGETECLVIVAQRQTAGRGRQGRVWESPAGNLYCSALLKSPLAQGRIGLYSFVAALALADTVRHCLPQAAITLKWPNDVLVNARKISGILIENVEGHLIIGMGLNIAHHPQKSLYPSTSLSEQGYKGIVQDVLDVLLKSLACWHDIIGDQGFGPIRDAWLQQAQTGPLTVKTPQAILQGEFMDLTEKGYLRLRLADGAERSISTGDVFSGI